MVNNRDDDNGFAPARLSWTAVTAVLLGLAQFIGVIFWAAGEHGSLVSLENRFTEFRSAQDNKNRDQDIIINHMDEIGTRPGQLIAERQANVIRRLDQLEQRMRVNEDFVRRQTRENFKPDVPPQWPPP